MIREWVLAALLALPVSKYDRAADPTLKRAQLETIADAISDAATTARWSGPPRELAALLIATAYHESSFALHVHGGQCRPHECDGGRARGLWQQQERSTSSRLAWLLLAGLDAEATRLAAHEAARALIRARGTCRSFEREGADWLPMTFSAYAGRGCKAAFPGQSSRVNAFRRLVELW
ncbi:MAG TPA: hypothetical protein VFQ61_06495 [Polyangiaceae bacterium]|nr:hypothetical protein [Polyangiaceae bacterium]